MSIIRLTILSASLMAMLSPAAKAGPFMEWLCGCSSNMTSQSTYAPAYIPTAVVAAPAAGCSSCAPQTTYYAPSVVYPTPVTTYRPFLPIVPRPTTTYYASPGYNPYSAAPVTVYRPVVPVAPVVTTTRLIPYTSYRMYYPTTVSYYGAVAPVVTYPAPSTGCCSSGVPVENYSQPTLGTTSVDAATEVPTLSPSDPTTANYPPLQSPAPIIVEKPTDNSSAVIRQDKKPATTQEPTSAPSGESKGSGPEINPPNSNSKPVQPNSMPNPEQNENQDRTTKRPIRLVSREMPVAAQPTVRVLSGDLWQSVKD
jgi:hypothetical protein